MRPTRSATYGSKMHAMPDGILATALPAGDRAGVSGGGDLPVPSQ